MSTARKWDGALRGYVPADGEWDIPTRHSHIRSHESRGRVIPMGIDPREPADLLDEWHHGDPVTDEGPEDEDDEDEEGEG